MLKLPWYLLGVTSRGVIDGAFRILQAISSSGDEHQVASIAEETGIPRASVYRLLGQLEKAGGVQVRGGRWVLSTGLLQLSSEVEPSAGLRVIGLRVIQQIREQTGAMVSIVVPHEKGLIAIEMVPGRASLPFRARAGVRLPQGTAAEAVIGASSIDGAASIRAREGEDAERVVPGMTCFAVPIRLNEGAAALQIATAPSSPARGYGPMLHRAAAAMESMLGTRVTSSPYGR